MEKIYQNPKKLFLIIAMLTAVGILSLNDLPVSLYPNSSKPSYTIRFGLESMTPKDFLNQYGSRFQSQLNRLNGIDSLSISAAKSRVKFTVDFKWGEDPEKVKQDITSVVEGFRGSLPFTLQRLVRYGPSQRNTGFYATSIYDEEGNIAELREKLNPLIIPEIEAIQGVDQAVLVDPNENNLYITIKPEVLAYHRINVDKLNRYLMGVIQSVNAGNVSFGSNSFHVLLKNQVDDFTQLMNLKLDILGVPGLKLSDVARIELAPKAEGNQIMRTNGRPSLILWVQPGDDGNIKEICETITSLLETTYPSWPKGSSYKLLVDPSLFIRSAISNVIRNIVLGGILAVLILMLFVGSIRSTIFTAIEIPLAIIWAFILMKLFDVSLNLISLGGLALTAGMNIDASIVMVENILRHVKLKKPKNYLEKLSVVTAAVKEVRLPIITSTISTIIVFLPLSLTSGIAYAILGDLAKAVIFSHGFSAIVALFLVPTLRLLTPLEKPQKEFLFFTWFNNQFLKIQSIYLTVLKWIILYPARRWGFLLVVAILVVSTVTGLFPFIKKEIIALPNTDSIWVQVSTTGTTTTNQVSQEIKPYEKILVEDLSQYVDFTFSIIWSGSGGGILVKLKDKDKMEEALTAISKSLVNTPSIRLMPFPWNPSKLPLPEPPDYELIITGHEKDRIEAAQIIENELKGLKDFRAVWTSLKSGQRLTLLPKFEYLNNLAVATKGSFGISNMGNIIHTIISGKRLGFVNTKTGSKEINVRYPTDLIESTEDLAALPIIIGDKLLPLKALVKIKEERYVSALFVENGRELTKVQAVLKRNNKSLKDEILIKAKAAIDKLSTLPKGVSLIFTDGEKEINESLLGLIYALLISLILIYSILYLQFNNIKDSLIIMMAIPLGMMGATGSLFLFNSTWSINSLLGIILLGGISVNNSILLVSFFHQRQKEGFNSIDAALNASSTRLKPIIITSLTTIFAMCPIAMGWGKGSEVLQPLGIAVSGGMLISTMLTLFVIPTLGVSFANIKRST